MTSHCIAVGEKKHRLDEFLTWFKNAKKQPNLSGLANINMPAGAGKKQLQSTKTRKGSSNKTSQPMAPTISRVGTSLPLGQAQIMAPVNQPHSNQTAEIVVTPSNHFQYDARGYPYQPLKSDRAATLPNFPASHNQFP
jgi:hypothetical protein